MDKKHLQHISKVIKALLNNYAYKATKYVDNKFVINATRRTYKGRINGREKSIDIHLKIGRPNYQERKFIALCRKAKEPFPVKKIQIKFPPQKRK